MLEDTCTGDGTLSTKVSGDSNAEAGLIGGAWGGIAGED